MAEVIQPPPTMRQMFPALANLTKAPRKFTPAQVAPFCEHLVRVMNKMLPATFRLVKTGDWSLTINVEIQRPTLALPTTGADESMCPHD
jgi:hypothetical protein